MSSAPRRRCWCARGECSPAAAQVPDLDSIVETAGGRVEAVGAKAHTGDLLDVSLEGLDHLTRANIPQ